MFRKRRRWTQKQELHAVHERDLEQLLDGLGVLDRIRAGHATCKVCGQVITLANLQCIVPEGDDIKFCCSNRLCFEQVLGFGIGQI